MAARWDSADCGSAFSFARAHCRGEWSLFDGRGWQRLCIEGRGWLRVGILPIVVLRFHLREPIAGTIGLFSMAADGGVFSFRANVSAKARR